MTGGVAYVFDQYGTLDARVNHESVELKAPTAGELAQIRELIQSTWTRRRARAALSCSTALRR